MQFWLLVSEYLGKTIFAGLGCPPEAHRSRAGYLHQNLPTFCAAPKTPSQIKRSACPPRARIVEPHPSSKSCWPAGCWMLDARRRDGSATTTCRRASTRICFPCSECVRGALSGQNGAECYAEQ
eukprot:scaffold14325_cov222-Isochrysis_galbana.AAC.3